jgi:hypothetical protein
MVFLLSLLTLTAAQDICEWVSIKSDIKLEVNDIVYTGIVQCEV